MKHLIKFIALPAVFIMAAQLPAFATFIPEEYEALAPKSTGPSNTDEAEFRQIVSHIQQTFAPKVTALGGKLSVSGDWRNEKLNAGARQQFGTWQVQITGGLARRPELTPDGFTLILCHELGHHLGGFAFSGTELPIENPLPIPIPIGEVWAATEGQADYFATHVCTHKIWAADVAKNAEFRKTATPIMKEACNTAWSTENEQNLCYRALAATESMILTMATLMKKPVPVYETPDTTVVDKTNPKHPPVQCRMDTSLQGAICTQLFNDTIIPGKKVSAGTGSIDAEKESAANSCTAASGHSVGLRPACWFKARM
jgi:hypothetical protein